MFYLTTHSTHFIYCYMASDIWLRTILIVRKETRCRHIGHSYRLTARVLLYASSHTQGNTYHSLCYTSRGALAGIRNRIHVLNQPKLGFLAGNGFLHIHILIVQPIIFFFLTYLFSFKKQTFSCLQCYLKWCTWMK